MGEKLSSSASIDQLILY